MLYVDNCIDVISRLPDESIDSIVTDPPYELGFMGKAWDSTGIAYSIELWRQCLRVLKPGGHMLAFSGSRTYHRMAVAIEDAGFDIRDQIMWVYGSGFPKSLNIGKQAGCEAWEGWGTALKPAHEPIVLARKPISGTIANNVLLHGTGALNIESSRVPFEEDVTFRPQRQTMAEGQINFTASLERVTEAKWYKAMMPKLYGWGAAVVILGALFKIEHLPGASYMLMAGLGIEAIIFFFSAFEKQPSEPDWSLVYPELANMEDPNAAKRPAQLLDDALAKAKIDNELIESLNEGLRSFGESTKKLNETIAAASGISEYNSQIQEGVKNMNALNSLYELQLQASNQQMEATNLFLQNLQSSVDDSKKFQEQVSSLADNLEQLNKVYSNMLNAMNPNR